MKFNFITNLAILFILVFGGVIWADNNGVWHLASDIQGGVFGSDEGSPEYTFNNDVTFNNKLKSGIYSIDIDNLTTLNEIHSEKISSNYGEISGDFTVNEKIIMRSQTLETDSDDTVATKGYVDGNSGAPSGAIMAFYLNNCPEGWKAADGTAGTPDLRGVFLRGMETFDGGLTYNNRDTTRSGSNTLGQYIDDQIVAHEHRVRTQFDASGGNGYGYRISGGDGAWAGRTNDLVWTESDRSNSYTRDKYGRRSKSETAPKNVALLYCMKK